MRPRRDLTLRGGYALFCAGQTSDEPLLVGNEPTWLAKAGDHFFGHGGYLVNLWQTADDRAFTLRRLAETRPPTQPRTDHDSGCASHLWRECNCGFDAMPSPSPESPT